MSYDDLEEILGGLPPSTSFVLLHEDPIGGQHLPGHPTPGGESWAWYDCPDHDGATAADLAASASCAIVDGEIRAVDRYSRANRAGKVIARRGYRCRGGRVINVGRPLRIAAISKEDLEQILNTITGDPASRSTNHPDGGFVF